jgi:hypothetical protein
MSTLVRLTLLMSALASGLITFASPTALASTISVADTTSAMGPIPDPTMGVLFALAPSNNDNTFVEPTHNETALSKRQATSLTVWVTHWFPPPVCDNGICTIRSTDDLPHLQINGEGFTVGGRVFGGIYNWPSNTLSWGTNINVKFWPGWRGGSFGLQTPRIDCGAFDRSHVANSYAAAYDWTTATWSPVVWLYTGCAVL